MINCPVCESKNLVLYQKWMQYSIYKCLFCQLFFIDPLPSEDEHQDFHGKAYFEKNYGTSIEKFYVNVKNDFRKEIDLKRKRLNYVLRFCNSGKILDIGTGQGLFLYTAKNDGWQVFGTDISKYVCDYLSEHRNIKMFHGYVEKAGLPLDYFDVVTMWQVLEHVYSPLGTLRQVNRALKSGGHLFVAVPNTFLIEMFLRRLLNKPFFRKDADEWHFYAFNSKALRILFNKLGFKILNIDSEFYSGQRISEKIYNCFSQKLLKASGTNICKTVLIHAVKQ
ncbi:MAG: class I SAM-dependent methyltransferase [Candidatus Omnitrophica bacterium]|nr:class I SAM-dependent methyltransferase [Candidatus Omnitrophota bacterium]